MKSTPSKRLCSRDMPPTEDCSSPPRCRPSRQKSIWYHGPNWHSLSWHTPLSWVCDDASIYFLHLSAFSFGLFMTLRMSNWKHRLNFQRMFISPSEINDGDLKVICDKSYPSDEFDDESFIPVKKLGSAFIAELFHGPTFCFKDIGWAMHIIYHFIPLVSVLLFWSFSPLAMLNAKEWEASSIYFRTLPHYATEQ